MNITLSGDGLRVSGLYFDAKLVLIDSAQVFHWMKVHDGFAAVCDGRAVLLTPDPDGDGFTLRGPGAGDVAFWRHYFDLDRDYAKIPESTLLPPIARQAIELLPGMRILNQPPWEALIAFILSANNNVRRIRQLVGALCGSLGEPAGLHNLSGFPAPCALAGADEAHLRGLTMGYRAPYLIETARAVTAGFPLATLEQMPYDEAHRHLISLKGVGPKVADCVLLFGCHHAIAFPVDVWVERLMRKWFPPIARGTGAVRARGYELFGEQAGLVQQYLFHCARLGLIALDSPSNAAPSDEKAQKKPNKRQTAHLA